MVFHNFLAIGDFMLVLLQCGYYGACSICALSVRFGAITRFTRSSMHIENARCLRGQEEWTSIAAVRWAVASRSIRYLLNN